jgi:hypothetical protein
MPDANIQRYCKTVGESERLGATESYRERTGHSARQAAAALMPKNGPTAGADLYDGVMKALAIARIPPHR